MDMNFLSQVEKAIALARKRKRAALGQHELTKLKLVQKRLEHQAAHADIYTGQMLKGVLFEVIESMKPATPENLEQADWRYYVLLRDYVVHGQPWGLVAANLHLARAAFYETRRQAIESLALALWDLEEEALHRPVAVKHNLYHPPYVQFVNRFDDKGQNYVDRLIDELTNKRAWVVVIDGSPGVGKTALAYRVAEECRNRELFDAVIWISAKQAELGPEGIIRLEQYVASLDSILNIIGVTIENRSVLTVSGVNAKLMALREPLLITNCLIVIDNIEALPESVDQELYNFLRNLPEPSKVLLTSRKRHYVGESNITLQGMELNEAMRFMRIEVESRKLPLTEVNLQKIYQETYGNPLAMRHAIGRMALYGYSVDKDVGQEVLLDYMFAETYERLGELERRILHVMPTFIEPASMEAISNAINMGDLAKEIQLTITLGKLYQLFLIDKPEQDRYTILPPLCRFLISLEDKGTILGDTPVLHFVERAHLNLANYYMQKLRGMNIDEKLACLRHEKRNVLAMLEWCYQSGEASLLVDLVTLMGRPLGILGYSNDRLTWAHRAMQACQVLGRDEYLERRAWFAANDVGWTHIREGDAKQAEQVLSEALSVAQEKGYVRVEALTLHNLGRLYRNLGREEKALQYLESSLALWRKVGDQESMARTMAVLGRLGYELGHLSKAHDYFEEALQIRDEIGHKNEVVETLSDLAVVTLAQGDVERAQTLIDQSLFLGEGLPGPGPSYAYARYRSAEMAEALGDVGKAMAEAEEALKIYENFGIKYRSAEVQGFIRRLKHETKS